MSTEQQYRVIGKSGPGVVPRLGMWVRYDVGHAPDRIEKVDGDRISFASGDWAYAPGREGNSWDKCEVEILEAISSPQAAVATCESWCGLPFGDKRVPCASDHPSMVVESHAMAAVCGESYRIADCPHPTYCTQACLDRAKAAPLARCAVHGDGNCSPACDGRKKAPECIRSACKAPPVAGGELCAAHAGQLEAAKAAAPPAETRLERWRREHKGYSHGTADPRIHDANVAAMMVGIDGPRSPYVPTPKPDPWTPRDLDGDIPDAWEPGGARLGR